MKELNRPKYEYKSIYQNGWVDDREINEQAKLGWEVYFVTVGVYEKYYLRRKVASQEQINYGRIKKQT